MMFYLFILPLNISEDEWADVWDKTFILIKEWSQPLIRTGYHKLAGVEVPVFTTPDDGEVGYWEICGEDHFGMRAGSFGLYRDLGRYQRWATERSMSLLPMDPTGKRQFVAAVFENKQNGHPYVAALIAVGILIENAVGENAVMHGEIDGSDVLRANEELQRIFGRTFKPPHISQASWVKERYAEHQEEELDDLEYPRIGPMLSEAEMSSFQLFWSRWGRRHQHFHERLPTVVQDLAQKAINIAKTASTDRDDLLRQLAENMLRNNIRVRAIMVDKVLPSLGIEELQWLVGLTDAKHRGMPYQDWLAPLIERQDLRQRAMHEVVACKTLTAISQNGT